MKNTKGITLIALVVTIIVLLILAGVSLNLVSGGDGILEKATTAVRETGKAKVDEEVEIAMAELKTMYYQEKYVDGKTTEEFNKYAKNKLENGVQTSTGTLTLKDDKISFTETGKPEPSATGSFDENTGSVTIEEITIGGNTQENTKNEITSEVYGEYVDLGTTILPRTDGAITQKLGGENPTEQPLTDWRIFHKDSTGTYLILADYLPYKYETTAVASSSTGLETGLVNAGPDYPYSWKSVTSRVDLIERLNGEASTYAGINPWNKLLGQEYINNGITVKGAVELETWVASWNENKGENELFIAKRASMEDRLQGYYIGTTENPTTTIQSVSNANTLYFPHTVGVSNNNGYWVASPSAYDVNYMIAISCSGGISYSNYYDDYNRSVRPVVCIPAGVELEKNEATKIWKVKINN